MGFALDGDADRCLAVDHEGNVVDGDQILAVLAHALLENGRLAKDTVVATVMSNLGFVQAMRAAGIGVRQTKVGDRYVLEAMKVSRLLPRRRAVGPRDHDATTPPPATAS